MKRVLILLLVLTLSGCASIKVKPPELQEIEKSREYAIDYDAVWIQVVDWFANHNVTIDKLEKGSGLITAKYDLAMDDKYLDCGDVKAYGVLGKHLSKLGNLNVTVRNIGPSQTKVNVNFFGRFTLNALDSWDGRPVSSEGPCVSKGLIEKSILESIK